MAAFNHKICLDCIDAMTDGRLNVPNDKPHQIGNGFWRYYIGTDFESVMIDENRNGIYSVTYQFIGADNPQIVTVYESDDFADCVEIAICCYVPDRRYDRVKIESDWNIDQHPNTYLELSQHIYSALDFFGGFGRISGGSYDENRARVYFDNGRIVDVYIDGKQYVCDGKFFNRLDDLVKHILTIAG